MEVEEVFYPKEVLFKTSTGTILSKESKLYGAQFINAAGSCIVKKGAILRGDLAQIKLGNFCIIDENVVIHPPFAKSKSGLTYYSVSFGNFVWIQENSVISAAQIGSFVSIGKNCVIGRGAILSDCCQILDNTIIPPNTVISPFEIYSGIPGKNCLQILPKPNIIIDSSTHYQSNIYIDYVLIQIQIENNYSNLNLNSSSIHFTNSSIHNKIPSFYNQEIENNSILNISNPINTQIYFSFRTFSNDSNFIPSDFISKNFIIKKKVDQITYNFTQLSNGLKVILDCKTLNTNIMFLLNYNNSTDLNFKLFENDIFLDQSKQI
ncbi:dynactin subunit 5 [Anaeramoeba ignava]|uniref:Dynactin subunit 5 n=1 Tax=Anaeramoeba ignava TaxID=1746090 RepID=A0A9Q0LB46_ANAIG|nr:dynactin subunit 5 [Anaeramoeba ignava]